MTQPGLIIVPFVTTHTHILIVAHVSIAHSYKHTDAGFERVITWGRPTAHLASETLSCALNKADTLVTEACSS